MPEPIVVSFATVGERELAAAFDTIEKRVRQLQKSEETLNRQRRTTSRRATEAAAPSMAADRAKSERAQLNEVRKAAREEVRIRDQAAKEAARIQARYAREAAAEQKKLAKESAAEQKRVLQQAQRAAGPGGRAIRSTLGTVSNIGMGVMAAAGGMAIGDAVMQNLQLRQQAALLVNNSRDRSGKATAVPADLVALSQGVAGRTGISAGSVMQSMANVSAKAGGAPGLNAYRGDLDDITKSAMAFGVAMEDAGDVYAAMLNAGVKPGEEARKLFQDLIAMGKEGSVEMADAAKESARVAGAMGLTSASGSDRMRQSMALMQIANKTNVSPEMSRTSLQDIIRDLYTGAGRFKSGGVDPLNAEGKVGNIFEILPNIIDQANTKGFGGRKGLSSILGRGMFTGSSVPLIEQMNRTYNEGYTDKEGLKLHGKSAVEALLAESSGASLGKGERDEASALVMGSDATKISAAMEQFKAKIGELTPEFTKLLPHLTAATQAFAGLVSWAASNPWQGIGALLSANVLKEVASAQIGQVLKTGIGAQLGALGTIAMTATAVYLMAQSVIDQEEENSAEAGRKGRDAELAVLRANEQLALGKITPEQANQVLSENASAPTALANAMKAPTWAKVLDTISAGPEGMVTPQSLVQGGIERIAGIDPNESSGGLIQDVMAGIKESSAKQYGNQESLESAIRELAANIAAAGGVANPGAPARSGTPAARSGVK